ncbi:asparagine synthase [Xylariales sp. PMI_506]|nr:asparagine synthase [Xylariales sp. PMI_506]
MCGIHAVIRTDHDAEISHDLQQALLNRGPDYLGQTTRVVSHDEDDSLVISFTSTVLALRGDRVAKQPFEDDASNSVLCWNGEAWKIGDQLVRGNDGEAVFSLLTSVSSPDAVERKNHILTALRGIQGPFAFLYLDYPGKCLYYGRDRLGRRSLLVHRASDQSALTFSSIADSRTPEWAEVDADGIYTMPLVPGGTGILQAVRHDWVPSGAADLISGIGRFNMALPAFNEVLDFTTPSVNMLRHHLTESLKLRVLNVPEPPSTTDPPLEVDVRISILFSGGLDCTVLARLVDEILPSSQGIDLINVAFQNGRDAASQQSLSDEDAHKVYEGCPDRITGRKAFAELKAACPLRWWRFIAVNVPFAETMAHRPRIVSLIFPHNTEMDLSICLALYFASRGIGDGYVTSSEWAPATPSVTTPARVLLSGLGADELFGGYGRHDSAFQRRGYAGLIDELMLDVKRIGERNLGRDDRVLSHWGKEVRFPYLDESFIKFAIECPVWEKCDFENKFHPAVIEPAKRALRLLADQLGLKSTSREKKRAIQFGARTAKLERAAGGPRVRGTDVIT